MFLSATTMNTTDDWCAFPPSRKFDGHRENMIVTRGAKLDRLSSITWECTEGSWTVTASSVEYHDNVSCFCALSSSLCNTFRSVTLSSVFCFPQLLTCVCLLACWDCCSLGSFDSITCHLVTLLRSSSQGPGCRNKIRFDHRLRRFLKPLT